MARCVFDGTGGYRLSFSGKYTRSGKLI